MHTHISRYSNLFQRSRAKLPAAQRTRKIKIKMRCRHAQVLHLLCVSPWLQYQDSKSPPAVRVYRKHTKRFSLCVYFSARLGLPAWFKRKGPESTHSISGGKVKMRCRHVAFSRSRDFTRKEGTSKEESRLMYSNRPVRTISSTILQTTQLDQSERE